MLIEGTDIMHQDKGQNHLLNSVTPIQGADISRHYLRSTELEAYCLSFGRKEEDQGNTVRDPGSCFGIRSKD